MPRAREHNNQFELTNIEKLYFKKKETKMNEKMNEN